MQIVIEKKLGMKEVKWIGINLILKQESYHETLKECSNNSMICMKWPLSIANYICMLSNKQSMQLVNSLYVSICATPWFWYVCNKNTYYFVCINFRDFDCTFEGLHWGFANYWLWIGEVICQRIKGFKAYHFFKAILDSHICQCRVSMIFVSICEYLNKKSTLKSLKWKWLIMPNLFSIDMDQFQYVFMLTHYPSLWHAQKQVS